MSPKNSGNKQVSVQEFPAALWNKFVGTVHAKGETVGAVLQKLIKDYLTKQKARGY